MHPSERGDKLLTAVLEGNDEEALNLLKHDVDLTRQKKGDNAIHLMARRGNLTLIKKLKEKGANMQQKNENGNTALHYAAKDGHVDIVKYLAKCKADINARNADGETPLHMAVISQSMDVLEEFVSLGMNVNSVSPVTGQTPLHNALKFGRQEAMEALLIKGAKVKVKDKDGKYPEEIGKTKEIRESLRMYGALLIAMEKGYIQARGLRLKHELIAQPFTIDRTDIILERIDIPKEMVPAFYCRREKVENSSVPVVRYDEEQVVSDVFHMRITDSNRDCVAKVYLPLYIGPTQNEELVLRYLDNEHCDQEPVMLNKTHVADKHHYFPLETKLTPETTCTCVVYVRPKQEENKLSGDGSVIKSKLQEHFQIEIPAGAFEGETTLSLKVFDTDDEYFEERTKSSSKLTSSPSKTEDRELRSPIKTNLLTSLYQFNVTSGKQPTKGILVQLPLSKDMADVDNIAIVHADEQHLADDKQTLELVQTKPKIVGSNIVFEVSQFCIYVATPKESVASEKDLLHLQQQISDVRDRRKPGVFMAVVKQVEGLKHLMMVDCVPLPKVQSRKQHWRDKGFELQTPEESESAMMKSGDTFTIEVKGRCSLEDQSEAQDRRVQFYQCRSSFQPYAVLLDPDVSAENLALVDVVVFKHIDTGTRTEVCQLRVQLTIPPPPAKPKTVSTRGYNDSRYKQPNPGKSPFQSLKSFFSR